MSKKAVPPEFVPVSTVQIKRLQDNVRRCLDDASCLCCWIDGLEFEVSQYISQKAFEAFNGFASSLVGSLVNIMEICKTLDLFLDL